MLNSKLLERLKKGCFDKPIGIVGSKEEANEIINEFIAIDDNVIRLDENASIDEIKEFRKLIIKNTYSRNIAIIDRLDKFNAQKQAVLLKIFENLPQYSIVFFIALYLPSFTIQTRSEIYYISSKNSLNFQMKSAMNIIIDSMKNNIFDQHLANSWAVFVKAQSLCFDNIISVEDKNSILNGLDVKFI